jgi:hypothetical protein
LEFFGETTLVGVSKMEKVFCLPGFIPFLSLLNKDRLIGIMVMIYLASTNSDKENKFRLLIFLLYKTRIRACLALHRHYSV